MISEMISLNSRQIEFAAVIRDLIRNEKVQQMEYIKHHVGGVSCLEHSIFVAYLSFIICKKLNLDAAAAARGGLLHDLYLCDWSKENVSRISAFGAIWMTSGSMRCWIWRSIWEFPGF